MAITIAAEGNGTSTATTATQATGATVDAALGDWVVVFVAAANDGTNGASSIASVVDSTGVNVYVQRAIINYDPGAAGAGATLGIYTSLVISALVSGTVTANFSPDTTQKAIQVYKATPGALEVISFVAADTTGVAGNATEHAAATVSVASGDAIFGAAAIETDDTVTGDTDTDNGSWSTILTRLADGGADAATMSCASQYKVATGTGNQTWSCTTATGRDSARTYIVLRSSADTVDDLLANDVSSASSVTTPAVGQVHALNAADVASVSSVSAPAIGQVHALTAADVVSASSVSVPVLAEAAGEDALLANDISSASSVSAPAIGQIHTLQAADVAAASSVGTPALGQAHALLAADVISSPVVGNPAIGQAHALLASDVVSASSVGVPALVMLVSVAPAAPVEAAPAVVVPVRVNRADHQNPAYYKSPQPGKRRSV